MLAGPVAVVVDSAALVAQVLAEAQLPVPARRPAAVVLRSLAALRPDRLLAATTWLPRVPLLALLVVVALRHVAQRHREQQRPGDVDTRDRELGRERPAVGTNVHTAISHRT